MMKSNVVFAQQAFVVEAASTQFDESVYFLNTVFKIELPDYIVTAVDQGFELPLVMEIGVYDQRKLWFDKQVVLIRQQYGLRYHLLLDAVSVNDINAGNRIYFSSLEEAIEKLSVLMNYPMLDNNNLIPGKMYRVRLRLGVDSNELPVPLKSSSLWENDWELTSDWFEWTLNP